MRRPSLALIIEINRAVRQGDEWFDEPDDLDLAARALASLDSVDEPVAAAAVLAFRLTRAQAFGEGNKRTALLAARWVLDRNGLDGRTLLPSDDRDVADLLVKAAAGQDVESALVFLLEDRAGSR